MLKTSFGDLGPNPQIYGARAGAWPGADLGF